MSKRLYQNIEDSLKSEVYSPVATEALLKVVPNFCHKSTVVKTNLDLNPYSTPLSTGIMLGKSQNLSGPVSSSVKWVL